MASATADVQRPAGFFTLLTQHPIGFWFIFWGEFAERCSYYGMRGILGLYMAERLGMGEQSAGLFMSVFIAGCYFLPLLGGYLADNYLGKYNIIVLFSLPYILGHFILGIEEKIFLTIALALLAMGSGVIKPNISTLMGLTYDQKRPGQELLRTQAFSIFYMAINIGAWISQHFLPEIRVNHGYRIAFLFPALLMVLAFILFAIGKPFYAKETIVRKESAPEERALRWKIVGNIGLLFLMVMFFWAIFDQSASTWVFYANVFMKQDFFGYTAEKMQSLNALLIVALLPPINFLFVYLANKGYNVRATDKIIAGFVLTAACMGTMAYCGYMTGPAEFREKVDAAGQVERNDAGQPILEKFCPEERKVSLWYQAIAYFLLTIAEILISVTGLELAFVAAPKNMKSFVTSLWLLTVGMANLFLNVPLSQLYPNMHPGAYFAMLTGMMGAVIVIFFFIATRFNRIVEAQKAAEDDVPASTSASLQGSTGIQPSSKRDGIQ
jgi:POT family proton-dependent oligopeptide transporter